MIDAAARQRAEAALDAVARAQGVRILLAVESGSRAWGFPSPNSDYDVRFIYVRPLDDYLSIEPVRDVIETPLDGVMDVGGWDVRKALGLLVRGNAVVREWLCSPVVYCADPGAVAALRGVAVETASLPALRYHYDRLARGAWAPGNGPVRLKAYCYALRPALAVHWMRRWGTPAPMDMPALLAGAELGAAAARLIDDLVRRKAAAAEAEMAPRCPDLDDLVETLLGPPQSRPATNISMANILVANRLFRHLASGVSSRQEPPIAL